MSTSVWVIAAWVGAAVLIMFLPAIMSDWTSFAVALGLAVLVLWKGFAPKRGGKRDAAAPKSKDTE